MQAALPCDEPLRLAALYRYDILDTPQEQPFDDITRLVASICQTPIAVINLIDQKRQWFKSACGAGVGETSRDMSFCAHAILERSVMVVPDALLDDRFADNPVVVNDPRVRYYLHRPKELAAR